MIIGLLGFEFSSPNKGCEALSYSFLSILRQLKFEDLTIINFTAGDLGLIPNEFPEFKFCKVVPKLKDKKISFIRNLLKCDYVFDVTMGDGFSDIYSTEYYYCLIRQKKIAELFCKNYILLPQTYGPYNTDKSKKQAYDVLRKAKKIYTRDAVSQTFIRENFHVNSVLSSDMAFLLPYSKNINYDFSSKNIKVGLNVSGLLYKGGFYKDNQFNLKLDYREYIDQLVNWFINHSYDCYIIPHVIDIDKESHDDDYKVSQLLCENYSQLYLAPKFESPIEAKSFISNMDFFIGSRMHSTIAAFSTGVITIPVSYSRKFEGLYSSLGYMYVINGREDITAEAFKKTIYYIENSVELKNVQNMALSDIEEKNAFLISQLSDDLFN